MEGEKGIYSSIRDPTFSIVSTLKHGSFVETGFSPNQGRTTKSLNHLGRTVRSQLSLRDSRYTTRRGSVSHGHFQGNNGRHQEGQDKHYSTRVLPVCVDPLLRLSPVSPGRCGQQETRDEVGRDSEV